MNVIARLEYELAYYDSAVHRFNHYTTRTPQGMKGGMKTVYPYDSNKRLTSGFSEGYQVWQETPEEDKWVQWLKHCEYTNQDEYSRHQYVENNIIFASGCFVASFLFFGKQSAVFKWVVNLFSLCCYDFIYLLLLFYFLLVVFSEVQVTASLFSSPELF